MKIKHKFAFDLCCALSAEFWAICGSKRGNVIGLNLVLDSRKHPILE